MEEEGKSNDIEFRISEFVEYLRLEKQILDYLREHPGVERTVQRLIKREGLSILQYYKWDLEGNLNISN